MATTAPIKTQTLTSRIPLKPGIDLDVAIKIECDNLGAAGYQLCSTVVIGAGLILIFQLTR